MRQIALMFALHRFCSFLEKYTGLIVAVSLLTAVVGGIYSVQLYQNLRTDMEELLPENAQSVKDVRNVIRRVVGLNHLSVVIESQDREAGRRFQRDVAERLRALPKTLVDRVKDNVTEEREFFHRNRALYLDLEDWAQLQHYVRRRVLYEKRSKNPFALGLEDDAQKYAQKYDKPEFDFDALRAKYETRSQQVDAFPDGIFESRDGKTHVVLAFIGGKVTDIKLNQQLSETAQKIIAELRPATYAPDMVVGLSGDVQNLVEEHHGLMEDLIRSFVLVTILVGLVLALFFRSLFGVVALLISLFIGVAWTFGLSYWWVGYLNANTAFLGSIVIGNGINCGIILLARYLEERRHGRHPVAALRRSIGFTTQATWTAAFAAGLAYVSLILTDFRGFNQFGVIGGLGMALCWLSSFTALPALLLAFERLGWIRIRIGEARPWFAEAFSRAILRFTRPIVVVTALSVVGSVSLLPRLSSEFLESDFSKLRNRASMETGSGFWGKKVDQFFGRYLTPTAILTRSEKDAVAVVEELRKLQKRDGVESPIEDIKVIGDFLPTDQVQKIKIIDDIREKLPAKLRARLSEKDKREVEAFLPKDSLRVIGPDDLPNGIRVNFREQDGSLGRMVHVYPRLSRFWDGKEVVRFAKQLREASRNAAVPTAIAGQPPLSADMITAIAQDGPKATAFALAAVILLVLIVFPRWTYFRAILASLLLGILWMVAVIVLFQWKINFLNFIALPITFGIGVDYAVNIFSRYRSDGGGSIDRVIGSTGGAVALCSTTTIIGYGSLLLAGSQAFVSFGTLAVLGEITCLVAAVVVLPAFFHVFEEQQRSLEPVEADAELVVSDS